MMQQRLKNRDGSPHTIVPIDKQWPGYNHVTEVSLIMPNLYLTCIHRAIEPGTLRKYGITHVVNISNVDYYSNSSSEFLHHSGLKGFLNIPNITDTPHTNIYPELKRSVAFIENALTREGGTVLVHCYMGISRSATIVLAYLMKSQKWSLREAVTYLCARRKCVKPNDGFLEQLMEWQLEINSCS